MISKQDIAKVKADIRNLEFYPDFHSEAKVVIWGNKCEEVVFLYKRREGNGKSVLATKYYDEIWEQEEYIVRIGTAEYLAKLNVELKRFVEDVHRKSED